MSLKINRQQNLEELFDKFAIDPLKKPLSKQEEAKTSHKQSVTNADLPNKHKQTK